jgi:predicted nuclease of predicted toxin-antitoxin system
MRILLDESLPRKLKQQFPSEHEVFTVRDKGWLGQRNGALLKLMVEDGFELFVTVDRNLPYQQNTEKLPLTVVVLCAVNNRFETLRALIPKLLEKLLEENLTKLVEIS